MRYVFGSRQLDIKCCYDAYAEVFKAGDAVTVVCEQVCRTNYPWSLVLTDFALSELYNGASILPTCCQRCASCGPLASHRPNLQMCGCQGWYGLNKPRLNVPHGEPC